MPPTSASFSGTLVRVTTPQWSLVILHVLTLIVIVALASDLAPRRWYGGILRGLHNTIGITTPSDTQLRWVLIVWIVSTLFIFDAMAALVVYVF
jgi:hypothetical protein